MVATGQGKDRYRATIRELLCRPIRALAILAIQILTFCAPSRAQRVLCDHLADLLGRDRFGQMVWAKMGGSGLCCWPVLETGQAS